MVHTLIDLGLQDLQRVSLRERLEVAPIIDLRALGEKYRRATKTKSIKAKPINAMLNDPIAFEKLVLDTLEGTQALRANSFVCVGASNDFWQQTKEKLFAKYDPVDVDVHGWVTFLPKPDNEVNAAEIGPDLCGPTGFFTLIATTYGDRQVVAGRECLLHYGEAWDWILQSQQDPDDRWRIARGMFISTYDLI